VADTFTILHCFRAPVGGLFRHVCDLVAEQSRAGHKVGIVCDSKSGGSAAEAALAKIKANCALGVHRVAMSRGIGPRDYSAYRAIRSIAQNIENVDILHGHGAKGGAYARLAARALKRKGMAIGAVYTPHGGSLHYSPNSLKGRLYLGLERRLAPLSDGIVFESAYSQSLYENKIGPPPCPCRVIPNGLRSQDFYDIILADDAADFLFIGELRDLKGVDVLLQAVARVRQDRHIKTTIVGTGPDERAFKDLAKSLGLEDCVNFPGYVAAELAFVRGRCLVVPSRAESFPYIVLESAARKIPLIVTEVGGVPEMCQDSGMVLLPPGDVEALAARMNAFLDDPLLFIETAERFREIVSNRYTSQNMALSISNFYREVLAG